MSQMNPTKTITSKDLENVTQVIDKSDINRPLVAVYCGSRMGNNEVYANSATDPVGEPATDFAPPISPNA